MAKPTDRRRRARRLLEAIDERGILHIGVSAYEIERLLDVIEAHVRAFRARPVRAKKRRRKA